MKSEKIQKNQNRINQTLKRFIYDGTATHGRESYELALLFVEQLFKRTGRNNSNLIPLMKERKIKQLIHFTLQENVPNILQFMSKKLK